MKKENKSSEENNDVIFILSDTYQLLHAIEWAVSNNVQIKVFNTNSGLRLNTTDLVKVYRIDPIDQYRTVDNVLHTLLTADQHEFFRCMYDPDTEVHIFDNVELMFQKGITDIHLHETGESSYALSDRTGYYGEDDPFTVAQYHITERINDTQDRCLRMKHRPIFDQVSKEFKKQAIKVLGIKTPSKPGKNTILFVHNEPDPIKYSYEEINEIHQLIEQLLRDIKDMGYVIWFKDHHKRPGKIHTEGLVDKILDCPIELLDTNKFSKILSVRSKCLQHVKGNCINGVTREAVTKCKKDFAHAYKKGIAKLRKNLTQ